MSVAEYRLHPVLDQVPAGGGGQLTGLLAEPPILFAAGLIGLVGSILLARNSAYGARAPAKAVPKVWLAAAVIQAFASFGHALRGELPPAVVFGVVSPLQLLAISLLWLGAARMAGRSIPHWAALVTPSLWLLACMMPGFTATPTARFAVYLPLGFGLAAWAALDLLGIYRRHGVRAALDMAVLVGIVTLTLASVVVVWILFPPAQHDPLTPFTGLPGFMTALFGTTLPFLMLAVSREWGALEEGASRNALLQKGRSEVERLHAGLPALIFVREIGADGSTRLLYRGGNIEAVTGCPAASLAHLDNLGLLAKDRMPLQQAVLAAQRQGSASVDWPMTHPDGQGVTWLRTSWRLQERRPDGGTTLIGYSINISAEREANARAAAAGRLPGGDGDGAGA